MGLRKRIDRFIREDGRNRTKRKKGGGNRKMRNKSRINFIAKQLERREREVRRHDTLLMTN